MRRSTHVDNHTYHTHNRTLPGGSVRAVIPRAVDGLSPAVRSASALCSKLGRRFGGETYRTRQVKADGVILYGATHRVQPVVTAG